MAQALASLTSIESIARQLDDARSTRLRETPIDFDSYMKARDDDLARVKALPTLKEELIDEFFGTSTNHGKFLPWPKVGTNFMVRPGEVSLWLGFNGHMKSMVTGYVMLDLMKQGEKTLIASFEMKARKTLRRLCSQAIGTTHPTELGVNRFLDRFQDNLFIYDQLGEASPDRVIAVIYYCAEQLGITQFVIDSLMRVVSDEDDYNGQKRFIGRLCAAAKDLNIHIHLVHHSRKREDESKRPGKQDAKGTGALVDNVDNCITVFKFPRKETEPDAPTHGLFVDKQRHGEWEGAVLLWFCDKSMQFAETSQRRRISYVSE